MPRKPRLPDARPDDPEAITPAAASSGDQAPKPAKKKAAPKVTKDMAAVVPFFLDVILQVYPPTRGDTLSDLERERLTDATLKLAKTYPLLAQVLSQVTRVGAAGEFAFVLGCVATVHLAKAGVVEMQYGQIAGMALFMGFEAVASTMQPTPTPPAPPVEPEPVFPDGRIPFDGPLGGVDKWDG